MLLHDWIEANTREVAERFPQFEVIEPPPGTQAVQAWTGIILPLPSGQELGSILEDLSLSFPVIVTRGGTLGHDPLCRLSHFNPSSPANLKVENASFKLQVLAFEANRHPRVYCISPRISRIKFPTHPHLLEDDGACPYLPSDDVWRWGRDTVADFLDFTSIWLAKHLVWEQTGAGNGGRWAGPSAGHSARELLRNVGRNDQCPCGSGEKYKRCHREQHISLARIEEQPPWLRSLGG